MGGGIEKARDLIPRLAPLDPLGAHLAQAKLDEEKKQFAPAETELRAAIRTAPDKVEPVLELAQFLARRAGTTRATRPFNRRRAWRPIHRGFFSHAPKPGLKANEI